MSGLYLEGASWNLRGKLLVEQQSEEMIYKMPILHICPYAKDENFQNTMDMDANKYACPVYRSPARRGVLSTTGSSTNFVIYISLPCVDGTTARTWVKMGTALLCEQPS